MIEKNIELCGLGNGLVDVQYEVSDQVLSEIGAPKGEMRLVDNIYQAEIISKLEGQKFYKCSGGSAANTLIAFSQLGGKGAYKTVLGGDENGKFYAGEFRELGIDLVTEHLDYEPTGTCLVLITPDSERTMLTNLAATAHFSDKNLDEDIIKRSKWLYLEGYKFSSEETTKAIYQAVEIAKKYDTKISVTFSDLFITEAFKDGLKKIVSDCDLIFCNEQEAKSYTGKESSDDAFEALCAECPNVAMTLGGKGSKIKWGGKIFNIGPFDTTPIDTTGAGDMYAGAFFFGILKYDDARKAGKLASLAASKVIAQLGARMSIDSMKDILKQIG